MKLPYIPNYERKDQLLVSRKERPTDDDYDRFVYLMDLIRKYDYDQNQILENSPFVVQDVLLNSILHRANECLRELASVVGAPTEEIDGWMNATRNAFKKLWDLDAKMHCDFDLRKNEKILENTIAIMAPLYAGLVDEEQARSIVELHLLNPNEYAPDMVTTKYFVPTVSKSSKYFDPTRYWLGPIWVNTNWMVIRGLERYGFSDIAERIRNDTLMLLEDTGFYEYFDPSTGKGYGTNQFSWSAALAIDLMSKKL
jgi:glycogen debranching enzyme